MLPNLLNPNDTRPGQGSVAVRLQAFSYEERTHILPALAEAMQRCGCWLLERSTPSATQVGFRFELQLRGAVELYTALVTAGLELTRAGHLELSGLCMLRQHGGGVLEMSRVVEVQLDVSFMEELHLGSVLMAGAALA